MYARKIAFSGRVTLLRACNTKISFCARKMVFSGRGTLIHARKFNSYIDYKKCL